MYDSATNSDGNCFGAIAGSKLLHDVLDMALDGLFRDEQLCPDIAIPVSSCNLLKNFNLAIAQGLITQMFSKLGGDFMGNVLLSAVHFSNRLYKLSPGHALEHVSLRSCLKGSLDLDVSFKGRKHDDAGICKFS